MALSKSLLLIPCILALAGCDAASIPGAGGAGGTGGTATTGLTIPAYDTEFNRISTQGATAAMPTTVQGTYKGETELVLHAVGNTADEKGVVVGDIDVAVNWTEGSAANPFSGTITNFRGEYEGNPITYTGTLNSTGVPNSILRLAVPQLPTGGFAPGIDANSRTGTMLLGFAGNLTTNGHTDGANVALTGGFGANAATAFGTAGGTMGNPNGDLLPTTGSFYIVKQ